MIVDIYDQGQYILMDTQGYVRYAEESTSLAHLVDDVPWSLDNSRGPLRLTLPNLPPFLNGRQH
jgi:hypothetical protein